MINPLLPSNTYRAYGMGYVAKKRLIGENSTREAYSGCCYNSHAEMDAIRKLPPVYDNKKHNISLIVVRVQKNGCLKNSTPCFKCIEHMNKLNS